MYKVVQPLGLIEQYTCLMDSQSKTWSQFYLLIYHIKEKWTRHNCFVLN